MKIRFIIILLVCVYGLFALPGDAASETGQWFGDSVFSGLTLTREGICLPGPGDAECAERTRRPPDDQRFTLWRGSGFVQMHSGESHTLSAAVAGQSAAVPGTGVVVYFFWGEGCPHCAEERMFLEELRTRFPHMEIRSYEVWRNTQNAELMEKLVRAYDVRQAGVPMTFVGRKAFVGFSKQTGSSLAAAVSQCSDAPCSDPLTLLAQRLPNDAAGPRSSNTTTPDPRTPHPLPLDDEKTIALPFFGQVDAASRSLPMLTIMIAGMDSFNPCAFFVLLSLMGLMIHARSRSRMFFVGGVFVLFSGLMYFLFMAAWLNLFLVMGRVSLITRVAGVLTLVIATINIKDFFLFKQGVSLTIPESAKPKLFDRMRNLIHASSLPALLAGTTILAIAANAYELLCTAGFPMVYTRILTLSKLSALSYYLYLALYNVIYVAPLLLMVVVFGVTLGKRQLTEFQGRLLKLVSGAMMLGLGLVLLTNPALLNNVLFSFLLLTGAVGLSLLVAFAMRKRRANHAAS